MKDRGRNLLVGLTVIISLVCLAAMTIIFRELPEFLQMGYRHHLRFSNASGVKEGSDVLLAGRRIGRVTRMEFTGGDARRGITLTVLIDADENVPGDVNAYIRSAGLAGTAYIDLVSDGLPPGARRKDPRSRQPLQWLPKDQALVIAGGLARSAGLIPPDLRSEIRGAMSSLKRLADTLNGFFSTPDAATTGPAQAASSAPADTRPASARNIHTMLAKLAASLDAVHGLLGDKQMQADFKAGVANFKTAAANVGAAAQAAGKAMAEAKDLFSQAKVAVDGVSQATKSASKRFDDLTGRLIDDAAQLEKLLGTLQRAAAKIDSGEGTAARLINDPKLYEGLLDATAQLQQTLATLQKLLEQWKRDGVQLKLK